MTNSILNAPDAEELPLRQSSRTLHRMREMEHSFPLSQAFQKKEKKRKGTQIWNMSSGKSHGTLTPP